VEALRQLRLKLACEGPRLEGGGGVPAVQQALQATDVSGGGVRRGAWPRVTLACLRSLPRALDVLNVPSWEQVADVRYQPLKPAFLCPAPTLTTEYDTCRSLPGFELRAVPRGPGGPAHRAAGFRQVPDRAPRRP
jgi:hypothetical protein